MAGRSAGGGSRGGGGRSMGGGRGGFSGGSRGSSGGFGGGSRGGLGGSSRGSSGRSMGSRGSSGRSFSSSGSNRNTSSSGNNTNPPNGGFGGGGLGGGGFGGGFGGRPFGGPRPMFFGPRRPYNSFGRRPRGSSGCLSSIIFIVIILFVLFLIIPSMSSGNSSQTNNKNTTITSNTVKREPLEKGAVTETSYYEDNLDWINNKTTLITGLKNFYNLTGIQPFILLIQSVGNDPTDSEIDAYANKYYDEHFKDEAHLLFMYIKDIDYMYGIVGSRGLVIMDTEAWDILFDYANNYWDSNLEDEEMFATVFTKAGERIMADPNAGTKMKTSVVKVLIIVVAIIIVISLLRKWQKDRAIQKQKEDENLKDILNTPLDTFGSKEMDDLMDKYKKDE